jgi:hypothetical protein
VAGTVTSSAMASSTRAQTIDDPGGNCVGARSEHGPATAQGQVLFRSRSAQKISRCRSRLRPAGDRSRARASATTMWSTRLLHAIGKRRMPPPSMHRQPCVRWRARTVRIAHCAERVRGRPRRKR